MEKSLAQSTQVPSPQTSEAPRRPGPVTPAGKETVSANSLKHGLCGKKFACLKEEREAFDKHVQSYFDQFSPVGQFERDLTRTLAESFWRLRRAHQLENALFEAAVIECEDETLDISSAQAQAWADKKALQRIALYAARIQATINKTAAELQQLQDQRKAAYARAQEEAIALTELARSQGNSFNPAQYFTRSEDAPAVSGQFVYSSSEIARLMDRARRLDQARALQNSAAAA